jgi:hypothetical protein
MTPKRFQAISHDKFITAKTDEEQEYYDTATALNYAATVREANKDRPLADAAGQVAAVAAAARQMLAELKEGWLWKILTTPPTPKG